MKTKTLDLLDAHFSREVQSYNALTPNYRFISSEEKFIIDPTYWDRYFLHIQKYSFNWNEIKYDSKPDINQHITSNLPGIYMFYIRPSNCLYDLPKFVLYIGISGTTNALRPLKNRLADYFRESQIKKRDALHRLLGKYYHYTYIAYSLMNLNKNDLAILEKNLIGFYYPIANKDDFPIEIEEPKKAFNRR